MTEPAPIKSQIRFAIIPEWVLWHPDLSPTAVRLYGTLSRYADAERVSFPGRTLLARRCGVSVRTIDQAVEELELAGALTHRRRWTDGATTYYEPGKNRTQTSSEYTLVQTQGVGADSARVRAAQGVQNLRTNENHSRTTTQGADSARGSSSRRTKGAVLADRDAQDRMKGGMDPRARWSEDEQAWVIPARTEATP